MIDSGKFKQEDFAIVSGIGCHAKIFDYLNLSGIYGLHGRVLPTALGITIGNPKLKVIGFAGDGDTYAEGMEHFIHSFRHNSNMVLIVHDNQSFSLTTGQSTPTSQQGYVSKAQTFGEFSKPFNPIKLALSAGAGFVARCDAKNIKHSKEILEKAINHKGFAYIEMIQDCLIFNKEMNNRNELMYEIKENFDLKKAFDFADEFDYNSKKGKIPIGIIYQDKKSISLQEKWPRLKRFLSN
jgi:2-oxoglutarate ferredoxin oxidoreductase subunit beta